jgi:hypothetical protein
MGTRGPTPSTQIHAKASATMCLPTPACSWLRVPLTARACWSRALLPACPCLPVPVPMPSVPWHATWGCTCTRACASARAFACACAPAGACACGRGSACKFPCLQPTWPPGVPDCLPIVPARSRREHALLPRDCMAGMAHGCMAAKVAALTEASRPVHRHDAICDAHARASLLDSAHRLL